MDFVPVLEAALAESLGLQRSVMKAHRAKMAEGVHFDRTADGIAYTEAGISALSEAMPELAQKMPAAVEAARAPAAPQAAPQPQPAATPPPPAPSLALEELESTGRLLNPRRLVCKKKCGREVLLATHRPELFPAGFAFEASPSTEPDVFDTVRMPRWPGRW